MLHQIRHLPAPDGPVLLEGRPDVVGCEPLVESVGQPLGDELPVSPVEGAGVGVGRGLM